MICTSCKLALTLNGATYQCDNPGCPLKGPQRSRRKRAKTNHTVTPPQQQPPPLSNMAPQGGGGSAGGGSAAGNSATDTAALTAPQKCVQCGAAIFLGVCTFHNCANAGFFAVKAISGGSTMDGQNGWRRIFDQLKDPANNRPWGIMNQGSLVRPGPGEPQRTSYTAPENIRWDWDLIQGRYVHATNQTIRAESLPRKDGAKCKKTSFTAMSFGGTATFGFGLTGKTASNSGLVVRVYPEKTKRCFKNNARTVDKPWIAPHEPTFLAHNATTLRELAKNNYVAWQSGLRACQNEIMPKIERNDSAAIMQISAGELACMESMLRACQLHTLFGIKVPVIVNPQRTICYPHIGYQVIPFTAFYNFIAPWFNVFRPEEFRKKLQGTSGYYRGTAPNQYSYTKVTGNSNITIRLLLSSLGVHPGNPDTLYFRSLIAKAFVAGFEGTTSTNKPFEKIYYDQMVYLCGEDVIAKAAGHPGTKAFKKIEGIKKCKIDLQCAFAEWQSKYHQLLELSDGFSGNFKRDMRAHIDRLGIFQFKAKQLTTLIDFFYSCINSHTGQLRLVDRVYNIRKVKHRWALVATMQKFALNDYPEKHHPALTPITQKRRPQNLLHAVLSPASHIHLISEDAHDIVKAFLSMKHRGYDVAKLVNEPMIGDNLTPLHCLVQVKASSYVFRPPNNYIKSILKMLLDAGADINKLNSNGKCFMYRLFWHARNIHPHRKSNKPYAVYISEAKTALQNHRQDEFFKIFDQYAKDVECFAPQQGRPICRSCGESKTLDVCLNKKCYGYLPLTIPPGTGVTSGGASASNATSIGPPIMTLSTGALAFTSCPGCNGPINPHGFCPNLYCLIPSLPPSTVTPIPPASAMITPGGASAPNATSIAPPPLGATRCPLCDGPIDDIVGLCLNSDCLTSLSQPGFWALTTGGANVSNAASVPLPIPLPTAAPLGNGMATGGTANITQASATPVSNKAGKASINCTICLRPMAEIQPGVWQCLNTSCP